MRSVQQFVKIVINKLNRVNKTWKISIENTIKQCITSSSVQLSKNRKFDENWRGWLINMWQDSRIKSSFYSKYARWLYAVKSDWKDKESRIFIINVIFLIMFLQLFLDIYLEKFIKISEYIW